MQSAVLIGKLDKIVGRAAAGLPVKIQLHSGDIVEILDARIMMVNGGEIHLIAGPAEEKEDNDGRNEVYDLLR